MTKLYRQFIAIALFVLVCGTLMFAITAQPNFIYVNNDTAPNTVSGFSIASGGVLTPLTGSPYSTGGNGSVRADTLPATGLW